MNTENSKPLQTMGCTKPFPGNVLVFCYGRPHNWRGVVSSGPMTFFSLADLVKQKGVYDVWALQVTRGDARVSRSESFSECVGAGGVTIHMKHKTDGVVIPRGGAFWLASADCPTIVVWCKSTGFTIAAHAGRDSLLDRKRIETGIKSREHESVVDAILEKLTNRQIPELHVFVCCGIGGEHFVHSVDDPIHGAFNVLMFKDNINRYGNDCIVGEKSRGALSLYDLIRAQFTTRGVPEENITTDSVNTFGDRDEENGEHKWWSACRGDTERNGVLVIRH